MADSKLNDHTAEQGSSDQTLDEPAPQQMVYRSAPKVVPFLVSGGMLGVIVAFFWVAIRGAAPEYSLVQTLSFFAAIFAIAGLTVGAVAWMIMDRRSKRNVSTVYTRRTEDPDAADVAVSKDDYSEWSQFQQNERHEEALREQFAQAKAQAKASKRTKRK